MMRRAWEVLLVVDRDCGRAMIDTPARYMPIWMIASSTNLDLAHGLRAENSGSQTMDITIFSDPDPSQGFNPSSFVETIQLHHPYVTRLNILGHDGSFALSGSMNVYGYVAVGTIWPGTIAFKRKVPADLEVPTLHLPAATWTTVDDVYDSLFAAIGSPNWHGRNFNALQDSVVTGGINALELPYKLVIQGLSQATLEAQALAKKLLEFFSELKDLGCPVAMEIDFEL